MNTEKPKGIIVPPWMVTSLISLLIGGFTAWGVASAKKAETETRMQRVEKDVEKKVGKELTQGNIDTITDAFEAYMDANGRGVI